MYSTSAANIYAVSQFDYNQPAPRPGNPLRQPKEYYNYSRYGSGDVNALQTGPVTTAGPTPTPSVSLGDVNADGTINIVDALLVAQYYVGLDPSNFDSSRADANCNGNIDIIDALLIAQYYVGLINQFCQ
jgi:hypothetical protein